MPEVNASEARRRFLEAVLPHVGALLGIGEPGAVSALIESGLTAAVTIRAGQAPHVAVVETNPPRPVASALLRPGTGEELEVAAWLIVAALLEGSAQELGMAGAAENVLASLASDGRRATSVRADLLTGDIAAAVRDPDGTINELGELKPDLVTH